MVSNKQFTVFENGCVDFDHLTDLMGVEKKDFADMIDCDRTSLRSTKPLSKKQLVKIQPTIQILSLLWNLCDGDELKIRSWLHEPRMEWLGFSPIMLLQRKKADVVIQYLREKIDPNSELFLG